ncbi:zinc finger CCHC domain-containing protein 4 [Astyanax mexicanus]|uniref:Zinc finger CCHC domain-containing protein 4 n=1 Tax=Astyanax mexicanus TaxID=7994 RepID=A0A8T2LGM3_ASTMX|nr:zinc finger CCHC domain-containing protein 4 [Astyanax mexicanus]
MVNTEDLGDIEAVIQDEEDIKAPQCPHGPAVLFEVQCEGEKKGRRFYACSACRDRKDCNFFQWENEKVSEARLLAREQQNRSKLPPYTHEQYCTRFREFASLPLDQKRFCVECQILLLPVEWEGHASHRVLSDITVSQLRRPSLLLSPLENKKSNAQYLFAERSCRFLLEVLSGLGFRKFLCVGTPRLHELIKVQSSENKSSDPMKSLLLDIDFRYSQFYGQDEFCHYNMFNHHFFNGEEASRVFLDFLTEDRSKVVMVADPPFGGLVKLLGHTFSKISETWRKQQEPGLGVSEMPMVWIFPYFFELRILECFPSFAMLDYQVDYDNHPLYKHGKSGRKQSPVRLFTNLCPKDIILPKEEGYRFCAICERYVSAGNKHCSVCNACTSKNGTEWKHCSQCDKCVKSSWSHCSSCGYCALPNHQCGQTGCFNCGDRGHKLRACPKKGKNNLQHQQQKKKKKSKSGKAAPGTLNKSGNKTTGKHKRGKHSRGKK